MTLEERYNAATEATYVGRVKATQEASVGVGRGVDFMDAGAAKAMITAPDTMQANFQRRASNDTTVTPVGDTTNTYTAGELKGTSRWYGRALNYAFSNPSSTSTGLVYSQWNLYKNFRTDTRDTWRDNTTFHRWTPTTKFNLNDKLSALAKTRATGKRPTPAN